jgi:hypothetical protein
MRVVVENYNIKEGISDGLGFCSISMTFCEHGKISLPQNKEDASSKLSTSAISVRNKATENLAKNFSVDGVPQFVKDAAESNMNSIYDGIKTSVSAIKDFSNNASEIIFSIRKSNADLKDLIETPLALAENLKGVYALMKTVSTDPKDLFEAYKKNNDYQKTQTEVTASTTSRTIQKKNQDSLNEYSKIMNSSYKCELILEAYENNYFNNINSVISEKNKLTEEIQEIIESTSSDDIYLSMQSLKTQIIRLIPGEKDNLKNTKKVTTSKVTNALELGWQIGQSISTTDDILARNKIINPLLILPLTEVEVGID